MIFDRERRSRRRSVERVGRGRPMQSAKQSWVGQAASVVSSGLGRGYRFIAITLRWIVLLGWVSAAVALTVVVPYRPDTTTTTNFGEL
jgi:hypothetical protein